MRISDWSSDVCSSDLGRLVAHDHRSRSLEARAAVRTLPEPRTRIDARFRHRLLRNPAWRGDPLRPGEIRPRSGRADHHLRKIAGARGAQGYRPRAPDELRPGRSEEHTSARQSLMRKWYAVFSLHKTQEKKSEL